MTKNIPLKTSLDVLRIKKPSMIASGLLKELYGFIKPGITTAEIDRFSIDYIKKNKAESALHGYKGFPGNVCISVNNVAAHGIGGNYKLCDGDILTVDTTVGYNGWYGDAAWTYIAGNSSHNTRRLIKGAWKSLLAGIDAARAGSRFGDIGYAVSRAAEHYGCRILEDFAGHGIGRDIHEDPVVLNCGEKGCGMPVVPGMVFTIEPILTLGETEVIFLDDKWSIVTRDSSLTAQFECTLAVFGNRTEILTNNGINFQNHIDFPPMF